MRSSTKPRPEGRRTTAAAALAAATLAGSAAAQDVIIIDPPVFGDSVSMQVSSITAPLEGPQVVEVTYRSSVPIDTESLDGEDIWAVSRNGYNQTGELRGFEELPSPFGEPGEPIDPNGAGGDGVIIGPDGEIVDPGGGIIAPFPWYGVRATYLFKPGTGDAWDADDDGLYAVLLQPREVTKSDGTAFAADLLGHFVVRVADGPGPILPVEARLSVAPAPVIAGNGDGGAAGDFYVANLELFYNSRDVEISSWGELRRDDSGHRFFVDVEAVGTPGADIDPDGADRPAAIRRFTHTYPIGRLEAGDYKMLATSFGEEIAADQWKVEDDPDPAPAFPTEVRIDVRPLPQIAIFPPPPAEYVADVRLEFNEQGWVEIVSWGEVERDGQTFTAEVLAVVRPWPIDPATGDIIVPPGVPPVFEHTYHLGAPGAGDYRFVLTSRDRTLGGEAFTVPDRPGGGRPPAEVGLHLATGDDWAVVRARVSWFEPGWAITEPGTVERADDGTFVINADAARVVVDPVPGGSDDPAGGGIAPPDDPVVFPPPGGESHAYRIPELSPGEYRVLYQINGYDYARAAFRITGGGGGGEPPMVHDIVIHEGDASWAAEVFVILPDPGIGVLGWGEPRREGNRFFVEIEVGPVPVGGPDPGVDPPQVFNADGLPPDFPVRLVSHTYPLGPLEPGGYSFHVVHEGDPVFSKEWRVREPGGDNEPPEVRVDAANIEEPEAAPHRFGVQFSDAGGLDHESIQDAAVWVVNERLGYRAEARLLSYAGTDDLPSTGASARYEVDAPGGEWDVDDRGRYAVHIEPEKVRDLAGNHLGGSRIGGFKVDIWPEPPGGPLGTAIEIVHSATGEWGANVSLELPEELAAPDDWAIDWGEVRHFGHVLVAVARYHKIGEAPEDRLIAPPGGGGVQTVRHNYRFGSLREGRYLFVVLSNLGHFGKERFDVGGAEDGGVEPPEIRPFEAWQAGAFMPGDWLALPAMVDPASNPDRDRWTNFEEYAFGFDPLRFDPAEPPVSCHLLVGERGRHLGIRYREMLAADDVEYRVLASADLLRWDDVTDAVDYVEREASSDGTVDVLACLRGTLEELPYTHLRILARPAGSAGG